MRFDLHVHSRYSADGTLEPMKIVEIARRRGLAGIAITDHNTITGALEAKQYESEGFQVIVGAEISTENGDVIGLFLSSEIESRDTRRAIAEIKQQGGLVVIPHPCDRLRHGAFRHLEDYVRDVDAIEVFNSRCIFRTDNSRAKDLARQYNLSIVAGSDAHYASEIGQAGVIAETTDLKTAILRKQDKVFGKRSSIFYHARTKMLKIRKGL